MNGISFQLESRWILTKWKYTKDESFRIHLQKGNNHKPVLTQNDVVNVKNEQDVPANCAKEDNWF